MSPKGQVLQEATTTACPHLLPPCGQKQKEASSTFSSHASAPHWQNPHQKSTAREPEKWLKPSSPCDTESEDEQRRWLNISVSGAVKISYGTSLVAQGLRIRLPMQGTQVRSLVWEDPTRRGATKSVHHNY